MGKQSYHEKLKSLMDRLVNKIYDVTKEFPRSETFGLTSQIRRSSLSIILNYIEGYARRRKNVLKNFLEMSYGSLKETKYLISFSHGRKYLNKTDHDNLTAIVEEIGRMLWGTINKL
jgi:four helix bundle protein